METKDDVKGDDGSIYSGQWLEDERHGRGCLKIDGNTYEGNFRHGMKSGDGKLTYKNGDSYSGWWKFGEKEGTGTYTFKSTGMKLFGEWTAG